MDIQETTDTDMFDLTERLLLNHQALSEDTEVEGTLDKLWRDWNLCEGSEKRNQMNEAQKKKKMHWIHRQTPPIKNYYNLEGVIGIPGQYGTVRGCINKDTGKKCAVKIIDKHVYPDPKIRTIFYNDLRNEAVIMYHVRDHENVVEIFEVFEDLKYLYIVMERLDGGELYEYLQKNRPLTEQRAAEIFAQMINAIYFLHSMNIVHCDLKPENFVFASKDYKTLKCIDFGMSKIFQWRKYFKRMNGTPYYVSPEVLNGQYNEGIDMWSLGICLFILVFGVPPFFSTKHDKKRATKEVYQKIKHGFYPSIRAGHGPWFPSKIKASTEVRDLIARLLRKNIADRITADEVLTHPWLSTTCQRSRGSVDPALLKSLVGFHNGPKLLHELLEVLNKIGFLNQHQQDEVRRSYQILDENHDGYVSKEELYSMMQKIDPNISHQFTDTLFRITDLNDDGVLETSELMSARIYRKAVSKIDRLDKLFRIMDTDGNGIIDEFEIQSVLDTCNSNSDPHPISYCKQLIQEIDSNGDGRIDYEEFLDVFGVRDGRKLCWGTQGENMEIVKE